MAFFCRSALLSRARSVTLQLRTLLPDTVSTKPSSPFSFPSSVSPSSRASRVLSAVGCVESLMPLHSAVASARLRSGIPVDSASWSWPSQGLALPL